jgi:hypothetical protein
MSVESDTAASEPPAAEPDDGEPDDALDWDLDERDRYLAAHADVEEDVEIDVVVESDR